MLQVHPNVLHSGDIAALQAARALVKAISDPDWGVKSFQAGRMSQKLAAGLLPYAAVAEVQRVLNAVNNRQPVDGRLVHYVKRRFLEQEAIDAPDDLDRWFEKVMSDPNASVMKLKPDPNSRYVVYSDRHHLLAVIARNGQRVSVHDHDGLDLGDVWCPLSNLLR
jgi:hypothetical protein